MPSKVTLAEPLWRFMDLPLVAVSVIRLSPKRQLAGPEGREWFSKLSDSLLSHPDSVARRVTLDATCCRLDDALCDVMITDSLPAFELSRSPRHPVRTGTRLTGGVHRRSGDILLVRHWFSSIAVFPELRRPRTNRSRHSVRLDAV